MRYSNLSSWLLLTIAAVGLTIGAGQQASAASPQDDEAPRVVRTYQVMDLLEYQMEYSDPAIQWPGTGLLNPSGGPNSAMGGGMGGGMGGMGGAGMGGGGMGSGMFAIPNPPHPQMGGMGGMDGGMFGFDTRSHSPSIMALLATLDLHMQSVDDFYADESSIYGGLLITRQTVAVHVEIANFLAAIRAGMSEQSTIQIEWAAVKVDAEGTQLISKTTDQQVLQQWIDERAMMVGSLTGLNGQLIYSTSGEHRNLVIGVTPVVGSFQDGGRSGNNIGYQSRTAKPVLGWTVQVRPVIPADPNQPGLLYTGISQVLAPEAGATSPGPGQVDAGNLPAFQVVGTVKTLPNTWTVVGGMAAAVGSPADQSPKYVVLVRWKR